MGSSSRLATIVFDTKTIFAELHTSLKHLKLILKLNGYHMAKQL